MKIKKILIVDDEETISSYLKRKLGQLGYAVIIASDGEQALELATSEKPDIILLDVKLPKLNGHEVCRRLKSNPITSKTPVLMLSAKSQANEIEEGLASGAELYLTKPIGFPDILGKIRLFES
jgi:DNA-binding response OmpR family regulator